VQVEGALFGIERSATTLQTLGIIEQLGGKAHYLACDVTDPALIDEVIQKIQGCRRPYRRLPCTRPGWNAAVNWR